MLVAAGPGPRALDPLPPERRPEHTELTWLLSSVIPLGELNRMHQFRDKSVQQREMVSSGLLFYPVLMAADVLVYRAHEVPVGEDQREHIELMRDAAERFNARYGEPARGARGALSRASARAILDLQEPARKMSTTGGTEQGTVYVIDEPDVDPRASSSARRPTPGARSCARPTSPASPT